MKTALCLLIFLAFYQGALAQYYDMVASKNINSILITFTQNFLDNKSYSEDSIVFATPRDTVWSTLKGKLDSNFITPIVFFGKGYIPFDYDFEHEIFVDGGERLNVHFRNKRAWEKVELEINFKNKHVSNATIRCVTNIELQEFNSMSCTVDSLGLMKVSTSTLKEFEENLKRILPYLL